MHDLVADHVEASFRPLLPKPFLTSAADPSGVAELGEQNIDVSDTFLDRSQVGGCLDDAVVDVQDFLARGFEETPRVVESAPANHELFPRGQPKAFMLAQLVDREPPVREIARHPPVPRGLEQDFRLLSIESSEELR